MYYPDRDKDKIRDLKLTEEDLKNAQIKRIKMNPEDIAWTIYLGGQIGEGRTTSEIKLEEKQWRQDWRDDNGSTGNLVPA